ncbi:MAG TPA: hypothetical protein VJ824_16800 [Bacillota bacterium]|nr:hypothetical protein [Bacillota bacterium]
MKSKVRKCLKWTIISVFLFVVVGLMVGRGGGHRYHAGGMRGETFMPHGNLHHSFAHAGYHGVSFILSLLLWGIALVVLFVIIQKRRAKRHMASSLSVEAHLAEGWNVTSTAHGDFLDQWEKNLNKTQEE